VTKLFLLIGGRDFHSSGVKVYGRMKRDEKREKENGQKFKKRHSQKSQRVMIFRSKHFLQMNNIFMIRTLNSLKSFLSSLHVFGPSIASNYHDYPTLLRFPTTAYRHTTIAIFSVNATSKATQAYHTTGKASSIRRAPITSPTSIHST
jgi:hypothetical protein